MQQREVRVYLLNTLATAKQIDALVRVGVDDGVFGVTDNRRAQDRN